MNEHTLQELIDQYLLGTISPKDKLDLEQLMASDPIIAEKVKESQEAFKAIQHERNRILKEKLKEIDRENPKQSSIFPRWLFTMLICLVAILIYVLWVSGHYNPSSIAHRYFENEPMPQTGISGHQGPEETWRQANEAFMRKEYEKAIQLYASWIEEAGDTEAYSARWNILLAQLALQGPTPNWKSSFITFLEGSPEPWKSKGDSILRLVQSGPYRFIFHGLKTNLSALKPRLI